MASVKGKGVRVKGKVIKFRDAPIKHRAKRKKDIPLNPPSPLSGVSPVKQTGSLGPPPSNGGDENKKKSQEKEVFSAKKVQSNKKTAAVVTKTPLLMLPSGTRLMLPAPKQKTKKTSKNQLPRIFRFITEPHRAGSGPLIVLGLLSLFLLFCIGIISRQLDRDIMQKDQLLERRAKIQKEILYWQGIVSKYKGYRDGYFKLAVLEYQLGNIQISQVYIEKTLALDPNFGEAQQLESLLNSEESKP